MMYVHGFVEDWWPGRGRRFERWLRRWCYVHVAEEIASRGWPQGAAGTAELAQVAVDEMMDGEHKLYSHRDEKEFRGMGYPSSCYVINGDTTLRPLAKAAVDRAAARLDGALSLDEWLLRLHAGKLLALAPVEPKPRKARKPPTAERVCRDCGKMVGRTMKFVRCQICRDWQKALVEDWVRYCDREQKREGTNAQPS